jgi:uncharacterized membrane protein
MSKAKWKRHTGIAVSIALAAIAQVTPLVFNDASAETVTACSRYGKGCVTAPVRRSRYGSEVRFPGGSWIGCSGDCREKLRDESIDFWDTHKPEGRGGGRN